MGGNITCLVLPLPLPSATTTLENPHISPALPHPNSPVSQGKGPGVSTLRLYSSSFKDGDSRQRGP